MGLLWGNRGELDISLGKFRKVECGGLFFVAIQFPQKFLGNQRAVFARSCQGSDHALGTVWIISQFLVAECTSHVTSLGEKKNSPQTFCPGVNWGSTWVLVGRGWYRGFNTALSCFGCPHFLSLSGALLNKMTYY